jgi:ribosomal protein L24
MNVKLKIKKKDRVIVLAGKDKGKVGEVTEVFPKDRRVIIRRAALFAAKPRSMCRKSRMSIRNKTKRPVSGTRL